LLCTALCARCILVCVMRTHTHTHTYTHTRTRAHTHAHLNHAHMEQVQTQQQQQERERLAVQQRALQTQEQQRLQQEQVRAQKAAADHAAGSIAPLPPPIPNPSLPPAITSFFKKLAPHEQVGCLWGGEARGVNAYSRAGTLACPADTVRMCRVRCTPLQFLPMFSRQSWRRGAGLLDLILGGETHITCTPAGIRISIQQRCGNQCGMYTAPPLMLTAVHLLLRRVSVNKLSPCVSLQ